MSILKCKYCGGDIEVLETVSTTKCLNCGSINSVPILNSQKKLALYNLANGLRMSKDFIKANKVYTTIKNNFNEVEAYFNLVLTKYGITYEDGKAVSNIICETSIYEDPCFLKALDLADEELLDYLDKEGSKIEEARVSFLESTKDLKTYDVSILVNDTNRKSDGYLVAKEMYEILSAEGKKVFFPTHALKNLEGREKEAQLYKALKSSRMLILFAKSIDKLSDEKLTYYTNKYLDIMDLDDNHVFVPCFENIKDEDIPSRVKQFNIIDLSSDTFIDNIMDIVDATFKPVKKELSRVEKLVKKGYQLLKEGDFAQTLKYADGAIKEDSTYEKSYLLGLLASLNLKTEAELSVCYNLIDDNKYYTLSKEAGFSSLDKYKDMMYENIYTKALTYDKTSKEYVNMLSKIKDYKDSNELINATYDSTYNETYEEAVNKYKRGVDENYVQYITDALNIIKTLPIDYKDCSSLIEEMNQKISDIEDSMCKEYYDKGLKIYSEAKSIDDYKLARAEFLKVISYKDTKVWDMRCKERMYRMAGALLDSNEQADLLTSANTFKYLKPYKESEFYEGEAMKKASSLKGKKKK